MSEDGKLAKHLANAFREAAIPGGIALAETLVTIGATINTGSIIVTLGGALIAGALTAQTANAFAKGLEKKLPEEEKPATDKTPKHKPLNNP